MRGGPARGWIHVQAACAHGALHQSVSLFSSLRSLRSLCSRRSNRSPRVSPLGNQPGNGGRSMNAVAGTATPAPSVDSRQFRSVLGRFTTGVVAVTALRAGDSAPVGLAVNSFSAVSLEPPLILFCVARTSTSWPQVRSAGRFCVNILGEGQRELSTRFATSGADKFDGVRWTPAPSGMPVLDGAIGWLDCVVEAEYPAGDHDVVIARVRHLDGDEDGSPLVFFRGLYGRYAAS
ncbi:flavin reductase family protein [Streptomyces sp. NPDC054956]